MLLGDRIPAGAPQVTWRWLVLPLLAATCLVLAVAVSVVAVDAVTGHLLTPAEDSAEAGFARDMAVHHAQAVEMAELVRDRAERDEVRTLAVDIALTQQAQIGRLHGWLDAWGLPITGTGRPMAWTGRAGDGGMPGLATRAQLNRLDDLDGQAAEVLFLQLMIPHHEAGVDMAKAVQERTRRREVRRLADAMVASQETEIEAMRRLLAEVRGESPPRFDARVLDGQGRVHR